MVFNCVSLCITAKDRSSWELTSSTCQPLKSERRHDANFVATGGTTGLWCHHWRQSWHQPSVFQCRNWKIAYCLYYNLNHGQHQGYKHGPLRSDVTITYHVEGCWKWICLKCPFERSNNKTFFLGCLDLEVCWQSWFKRVAAEVSGSRDPEVSQTGTGTHSKKGSHHRRPRRFL